MGFRRLLPNTLAVGIARAHPHPFEVVEGLVSSFDVFRAAIATYVRSGSGWPTYKCTEAFHILARQTRAFLR